MSSWTSAGVPFDHAEDKADFRGVADMAESGFHRTPRIV
jgi:hypothetical protein